MFYIFVKCFVKVLVKIIIFFRIRLYFFLFDVYMKYEVKEFK